jgi:IclR family transcriptional regulator, KDG regulon repressor
LNRYASPAVGRALDLFDYLAQHGSCSLTDVVRDLGLSKSTAYGLLLTLEERGYLRRNAAGKYQLGLALVNLSRTILNRMDVREVSEPFMARLAAETKETVHLGVLSGTSVVQIGKAESPLAVKLTSYVGQTRPLHSSGLGKALLAFLPENERAGLLARMTFERKTPRTIFQPDVLRQALEETRLQGFAIDDEENTMGVRCVAAPIWDYTGRVVASVSASGPADRVPLGRVPEIAGAVTACAHEISSQMGYLGVH